MDESNNTRVSDVLLRFKWKIDMQNGWRVKKQMWSFFWQKWVSNIENTNNSKKYTTALQFRFTIKKNYLENGIKIIK